MKTNIPQNTYNKKYKLRKFLDKVEYYIPFILVVLSVITILMLSFQKTENELLEKENDLLRTELNLKTEKLFFIEQENNHPNQ